MAYPFQVYLSVKTSGVPFCHLASFNWHRTSSLPSLSVKVHYMVKSIWRPTHHTCVWLLVSYFTTFRNMTAWLCIHDLNLLYPASKWCQFIPVHTQNLKKTSVRQWLITWRWRTDGCIVITKHKRLSQMSLYAIILGFPLNRTVQQCCLWKGQRKPHTCTEVSIEVWIYTVL